MADNLDRAIDVAAGICELVGARFAHAATDKVLALAVGIAAGRLARQAGAERASIVAAVAAGFDGTRIEDGGPWES